MENLEEFREWLRFYEEDEDKTLSSLVSSSRIMIKQATGITKDDVDNNPDALELYKLVQKIIIAILYDGDIEDLQGPGLTSMYMQLEAYGLEHKKN